MKKTINFESQDNLTTIQGYIYEPTLEPKAIIQFSHGMMEHIEKYEVFAEIMNKYGIIFAGIDLLGHGASVQSKDYYGYFTHKNQYEILIEDTHNFTLKLKETYPNIPIILIGHSMGSYLTRTYIQKYSNDIEGFICMGSSKHSNISIIKDKLLTSIISLYNHGEFYKSNYIYKKINIDQSKRFEERKSNPFCWINKNKELMLANSNPLYTNHKFTCNGYQGLFSLMLHSNKKVKTINKDLPILILSGKDDPVGAFGKDIYKIEKLYKSMNIKDVTIKIYNGMRHDLINDENKVIVHTDIINFINKCINKKQG